MDIKPIPMDEKKTWRGNCSERVMGPATRIRGFRLDRECQSEATWLVDGKRYCTRHKKKRTPAESSSS